VIGWEDYTLVISFMSKGFPVQRPDWRVIYCNDFILCKLLPTGKVSIFLINFNFLTAAYLSEARYNRFVLKVPKNRNESNQFVDVVRLITAIHCKFNNVKYVCCVIGPWYLFPGVSRKTCSSCYALVLNGSKANKRAKRPCYLQRLNSCLTT